VNKVSRLILGLASVGGLVAGSTVVAAPAFGVGSKNNNGAVVVNSAGGGLIASDGTIFVVSTQCKYLINHSGATLSSCHAQQPSSIANPTSPVIFDYADTGWQCDANGVGTYNWSETVSTSGQVNLTCHG
jgi:hypothetical protein